MTEDHNKQRVTGEPLDGEGDEQILMLTGSIRPGEDALPRVLGQSRDAGDQHRRSGGRLGRGDRIERSRQVNRRRDGSPAHDARILPPAAEPHRQCGRWASSVTDTGGGGSQPAPPQRRLEARIDGQEDEMYGLRWLQVQFITLGVLTSDVAVEP